MFPAVYKTKWFDRFARKARVDDSALWRAALAADAGMVDADLGSGIVKQRIARRSEGKSGGSRTLLVIRRQDRAVYIFGFQKKDRENIETREWEALKKLAKEILSLSDAELGESVRTGELIEIEEEAPYGSEI